LSIVAFACALLSKATAVTLPALLLILNVYPMRRVGGAAGWWSATARRAYVELVPFAIASLAVGVMSIVALQPGPQLAWSDKLPMSAYALAFYLWKSIAPFNLAPLYERPSRLATLSPTFIASYATVLGSISVAWLARRRWPAVPAAFAGFVVAVFPLLGVIQNGPQIAADRYTYHAAPVLALLFAKRGGGRQRAWRARGARMFGRSDVPPNTSVAELRGVVESCARARS